MKITYLGGHPVDIPGHDNVQPGDTVDVVDDVAASLLEAGSSHIDLGDGEVKIVPPAAPLWEASAPVTGGTDRRSRRNTTTAPADDSADAESEEQS